MAEFKIYGNIENIDIKFFVLEKKNTLRIYVQIYSKSHW